MAIATDLMLVIGLVYILYQIRALIDVSFQRMFVFPTVALLGGGFVTWKLASAASLSDVWRLIVKAISYSLCYSIVLLIFERHEYMVHLHTFLALLLRKNTTEGIQK